MLSGDEKMINIVNQLVEYIKKHDFANTDVSNIVEKDIPLDLSELLQYSDDNILESIKQLDKEDNCEDTPEKYDLSDNVINLNDTAMEEIKTVFEILNRQDEGNHIGE